MTTARKLSPEQLKALNNAMLDVFSDSNDLERCLLFECKGQSLNRITVADSMTTKVQKVIEHFIQEGRLAELIDGVHRHKPRNPLFCAFLVDHWDNTDDPSDRQQRGNVPNNPGNTTRPAAKSSIKALVYGVAVGEARFEDVIQRLGLPTRCGEYRGRPVAEYADHGLIITFENDPPNPHIHLLRVTANASELPFGLRNDMPARELVRILDRVYETTQDDPFASTLLYEPQSGRSGHHLTMRLRNGKLDYLLIRSPQDDN